MRVINPNQPESIKTSAPDVILFLPCFTLTLQIYLKWHTKISRHKATRQNHVEWNYKKKFKVPIHLCSAALLNAAMGLPFCSNALQLTVSKLHHSFLLLSPITLSSCFHGYITSPFFSLPFPPSNHFLLIFSLPVSSPSPLLCCSLPNQVLSYRFNLMHVSP